VSVAVLVLIGAMCFAGLGLLTASRARTTEMVSGLMNLIMMPMWILSGVFFSSANFPAAMQPLIKVLPLTALNDALRAVILDGASLAAVALPPRSAWRGVRSRSRSRSRSSAGYDGPPGATPAASRRGLRRDRAARARRRDLGRRQHRTRALPCAYSPVYRSGGSA